MSKNNDWGERKRIPSEEAKKYSCPRWWCQIEGVSTTTLKSFCPLCGMSNCETDDFVDCDNFCIKKLCWEKFLSPKKPVYRLEDWEYFDDGHHKYFYGKCYGNSLRPEGTQIRTSKIIEVRGLEVETQNSIYMLAQDSFVGLTIVGEDDQ